MSNKNRLIEKYLLNTLSKEERVLFDKLYLEDDSFKVEVEFQQDLKKAITKKDQEDFKKLIESIENNVSEIQNKNNIKSFYKWFIAASLILFFGITFFVQFKNQYNPEVIFEENFIPYKNVIYPINRGAETNGQDLKILAFLAYEKGNYSKAVDLFTELYEQTNEPYYLFYKANALLKMDKAEEAIPVLKEHLKSKDTLKDKSNWYLALAYIKVADTKKAKELLNRISEKELYNYKKAKKILKKMP